MEQTNSIILSPASVQIEQPHQQERSERQPFILANTVETHLEEIKQNHIIPVFTKDNEPLISHTDFIESAYAAVSDMFAGEEIEAPIIRLSHPIKGRIPEAKDKPANLLTEREKTIYYERMAFVVEVPSVYDYIDGNKLSLTIGGVKAYNQDNLYSRSICDQHFKVFIGFQNKVCTNLCVWTDGLMDNLKVKNINQLKAAIKTLIESYNQGFHLHHLKKLTEYSISEAQFAHMIGRCRMYQHLPQDLKAEIPPILFGDQQINSVVRDYYKDGSFCRNTAGDINLWRLFNLFTGANKSSYIDSYLERSVNAFQLVEQMRNALEAKEHSWYLN